MKVYDYYREVNKRNSFKKAILGIVALIVLLIVILAISFYMEIIQLNEIGNYSSIYIRNLIYKVIFFIITYIIIFTMLFISNKLIEINFY